MKYEIQGFHKQADIDNWQGGCQFEGGYSTYFDYSIKANTKEDLDNQLRAFFGDNAGIEFNACDEQGRIDIQRTENDEGEEPTFLQLKRWKDGLIDLWAVTYTAYCESVTRNPAEF